MTKNMTKKAEREITRSRKAQDMHSMDSLHWYAIGMEVNRCHDHWCFQLEWLGRTIANKKAIVDEFANKLLTSEDPSYEMRWADGPMDASANLFVYSKFLEILKEKGIKVARRVAEDEVQRGARSPSHSTSPSSNFMAQSFTSAWAHLIDEYRYR